MIIGTIKHLSAEYSWATTSKELLFSVLRILFQIVSNHKYKVYSGLKPVTGYLQTPSRLTKNPAQLDHSNYF